ncbi:Transferrin receptor-like, ESAG6-like [Trypanosoma congolense IL3000]|uniref:Transferrin receptor-like, ESAG6-like n=1 Tax=Trypanosoma congolense (strain IL3000) TaxID=1068625 RepID=F9WDF3_TRYCI|nr:Transferrin receptor-like, ESAG6-like [Trypanosoma congolense IL3000]
MLQAMKALGIIFMMSVFFSEKVWADSFHHSRKTLPTEAGGSICSLSRKLKEVAPWTQQKLEALKKTRDAYASKLLDWQLHFHGSSECELNESILEEIQADLEKVNEEIKKLSAKAIRAGALAAKSAGRLDEFITVFAKAQGRPSFMERANYCLGSVGEPARRSSLFECFPEGNNTEIEESSLARISESLAVTTDLNLATAIEKVKHSAVEGYFKRVDWDDLNADCNLINGKTGILSGVLNDKLWWGGGILTIGKCFDGEIKVSQFGPGEVADTKDSTANWTASPHTIPHLRKTLAAFQAFKDAAARISQKFSEIENIEKQIEPCLSNETMEERPTQSCFQNAIKLNVELQAANALLSRYHKEKGPLPSGSTLILHQSVVTVWFSFAFLL